MNGKLKIGIQSAMKQAFVVQNLVLMVINGNYKLINIKNLLINIKIS